MKRHPLHMPSRMKALWFDGQLSVKELPAPTPAPGEALIRVVLAGVCGTDRQVLKGYAGFRGVPGHEFVGEVVECEADRWIGKRVVGEINVTCGSCEWCKRNLARHCANRTVMGIIGRQGAFAEYLALPVMNLHEVPEAVPDRAAVFTEPLAAACEILEQVAVSAGTPVAVLGAGRLGLLVAQVLAHAGARVTVIGPSAWKLALARSWGLSTVSIAPGTTTANSSAADGAELSSRSFPLVVEATGAPQGLSEALRLVEPRGTVVMKSTFRQPAQFDTAKLVVDEITLLGSRCGSFSAALDLLASGAIDVQGMVSRIFPLESALEAFEYLENSSCLKLVLDCNGHAGA